MSSQIYEFVPNKDADEIPFAEDVSIAEGLLKRPEVKNLPNLTGRSMMQITAPAALPEGYDLPVQMGSSKFKVKVPLGGVEQGQVFMVPIPQESVYQPTATPQSIPVGAWRDNECDCFNYGACHPHIWTSCLCPLLAAGQVINRLHFNWTAAPASTAAESSRAFAIIFVITVAHWILFAILEVSAIALYPTVTPDQLRDIDNLPEPEGLLLVIMNVYTYLKWLYLFIIFLLLFTLRKSVRGKFGIPGNTMEDCCCAVWCQCCVVGQMLRHTTDYDVHQSRLCSPTGLSAQAGPMIV